MKRHITLYTKPGCHLCDLVHDDLQLLGYEMDLSITTIDVTTVPALAERFLFLVPAVDIDQGPLLTPPITLGRLRAALMAPPLPAAQGVGPYGLA